ncbi:hypothetical protein Taro_013331 [Colocasia esculenta]|uniref:Uncharacterized protein n=1 Tax=Colocasia esculenta TaxID=4460 RepID=A0A843UBA2_COLES|nr:hypothetical protein [Colocasia esculenta]
MMRFCVDQSMARTDLRAAWGPGRSESRRSTLTLFSSVGFKSIIKEIKIQGAALPELGFQLCVYLSTASMDLSTDALRLKVLGSGQGFLSTGRPSSVDRGYVNGLKAIPFDLQRIALWRHAFRALGAPVDRRKLAGHTRLLEGSSCRQATGCCRQAQADRRIHSSGNLFLSTGSWVAVDRLICSADLPSGLGLLVDRDTACCRQMLAL